jgi:hypothetical protein
VCCPQQQSYYPETCAPFVPTTNHQQFHASTGPGHNILYEMCVPKLCSTPSVISQQVWTPRPQFHTHDWQGRGENRGNMATFSPTSSQRCSDSNISAGFGNKLEWHKTQNCKAYGWTGKFCGCSVMSNPNDGDKFGLWNISWFQPPDMVVSLRRLFWILSPWKLQDIHNTYFTEAQVHVTRVVTANTWLPAVYIPYISTPHTTVLNLSTLLQ